VVTDDATNAGWLVSRPGRRTRHEVLGRSGMAAGCPTGSIWVTNAMAAYSLILGFMAFLLDFK
jgi:hypothetical protein